jgi:hypothetical protein
MWAYRIAGVFLIYSGIDSYIDGWDYKWGVPISLLASFMVSLIGIIAILFSFQYRSRLSSIIQRQP